MTSDQTQDTPPPGSDEAIDAGCRCPVLDNAHGIGYMGVPGSYIYTIGCPVHNQAYLLEESSPDA